MKHGAFNVTSEAIRHASDYLKCPEDDPQTGTAFGICGVLYMLLSAMHAVKQLQYIKLVNKIKETLNKMVSYIEQKGCLPKIENGEANFNNTELDFATGFSGIIPLLSLAAQSVEIFDEQFRGRLLNAAV